MRRWFTLLLALAVCTLAAAQEEDILRAALYLSGAASPEEIPEEWINLLEGARRIRINDPRLRPGPLLSAYQVASLADYRSRSGDILSFEELALVDGFSREAVAALAPFLSLESARLPGSADTARVQGSAFVRSTLTALGGKAKVNGQGFRLGGALRGNSSAGLDGTFYGEVSGRLGRLVVGDYNLRFGQGLQLWSGFSMSSLSTVGAFLQRSTGLSPVWSYTSSSVNRGLGYEGSIGRQGQLVAFASLDGLYGVHGAFLGRWGQLGASLGWKGNPLLGEASDPGQAFASLDGRMNCKGVSGAFELAWKPGALAGKLAARSRLGESFELALQARALPSRYSGKKNGEYAVAAGLAYTSGNWRSLQGKTGFGSSVPVHKLSLTADAALLPIPASGAAAADPWRLQLRAYASWQWQLSSRWALDARLTERFRNYEASRTDVRADLRLDSGPWLSVLRVEGVHCEGWGGLVYWEGGYKAEALSGYFRLTGFLIDKWADRIYTYERDAPGTFSVPAYSGRGLSVSAVGSWKHRFLSRFTLKVYARAACSFRVGRTPAPTLNLQIQLDR